MARVSQDVRVLAVECVESLAKQYRLAQPALLANLEFEMDAMDILGNTLLTALKSWQTYMISRDAQTIDAILDKCPVPRYVAQISLRNRSRFYLCPCRGMSFTFHYSHQWLATI